MCRSAAVSSAACALAALFASKLIRRQAAREVTTASKDLGAYIQEDCT